MSKLDDYKAKKITYRDELEHIKDIDNIRFEYKSIGNNEVIIVQCIRNGTIIHIFDHYETKVMIKVLNDIKDSLLTGYRNKIDEEIKTAKEEARQECLEFLENTKEVDK